MQPARVGCMTKKTSRRRPFRHLNQYDRDRIEALLSKGHLQGEIAAILQVDKGTISREISSRKRKNGRYEATTAQHKTRIKRLGSKYQGMKIEKYPELRTHLIVELKKKRSPDEIAGRMKRDGIFPRVGTYAIYKWLYSSWGQAYCKNLCTKRYRKKKQGKKTKREMIPNRISLKQRPKEGEHAEGDLFVSPLKTGTKRSGAIVCIPSVQLLVGTMIPNKKPAQMTQGVKRSYLELLLTT